MVRYHVVGLHLAGDEEGWEPEFGVLGEELYATINEWAQRGWQLVQVSPLSRAEWLLFFAEVVAPPAAGEPPPPKVIGFIPVTRHYRGA